MIDCEENDDHRMNALSGSVFQMTMMANASVFGFKRALIATNRLNYAEPIWTSCLFAFHIVLQ